MRLPDSTGLFSVGSLLGVAILGLGLVGAAMAYTEAVLRPAPTKSASSPVSLPSLGGARPDRTRTTVSDQPVVLPARIVAPQEAP
ncbi:MAG: hypothetical protein H6923_08705 [Alphaproteobacteria bacterium]|nr:hypothetical protein [Alphaproteobacteria bacterium]